MPTEPHPNRDPIPYPDTADARRRRETPQSRSQLAALSDESLIELTLSGNVTAFETLLRRYNSVVAGYLYGKVPRGFDIEDLAQEIFLAAHQKLDQLRNRKKFGPWLMKIARHSLFDLARERRRPETAWQRMPTVDEEVSAVERLSSQSPNPAEIAHETEQRELLAEAIASLKDKYRLVLYMRLIDQMPPHLISIRLGISGSATRVRLHRGLDMLRAELVKRGHI